MKVGRRNKLSEGRKGMRKARMARKGGVDSKKGSTRKEEMGEQIKEGYI